MSGTLRAIKSQFRGRAEARAREQFLTLAESRAPKDWVNYRDLHPASPALAGISVAEAPQHINVLLNTLSEESIFAGVRTALGFAANLASRTDAPLRVLHFGPPLGRAESERVQQSIAQITTFTSSRVTVRSLWHLSDIVFSPEDLWVATYWSTAHALEVSCKLGRIDRSRVIYLVQDYEPEFFPSSTQSALCRATYHAGFTLVVNSNPLREYLQRRESIEVDPLLTFRPELDVEGLARAAESRTSSDTVRIAFYGRPSKPRNSFELGTASVRVASQIFERAGTPVTFVSVGEAHPQVDLGARAMKSLGKLPWDGYFDFLASSDVMFSLQQTPHPSHLPLDAIASGGFAVTNDYEGTRSSLSARLLATSNDPDELGRAIVLAADFARQEGSARSFDTDFVESLGSPLSQVLVHISRRFDT